MDWTAVQIGNKQTNKQKRIAALILCVYQIKNEKGRESLKTYLTDRERKKNNPARWNLIRNQQK